MCRSSGSSIRTRWAGLELSAIPGVAAWRTAYRAFGVKKTFGLLPGRVTFVFDKNGVCKSRFDSQLRVGKHVDDALALVKKLAA